MARKVRSYRQKPAYPIGTITIMVILVAGAIFGLFADERGGAVVGLVMVLVKLACLYFVTIGLVWAIYLLWGKGRDTNAGLLSLGLSALSGFILLYLLFIGKL